MKEKRIRLRRALLPVLLGTAAICAGCAAPGGAVNPSSVNSVWTAQNVIAAQRNINGVLVVVLGDNQTDRRILEDVVSNVFAFQGSRAYPSYELFAQSESVLASDGSLNLTMLTGAAQRVKASDILVIRSRGVKSSVTYNPGMTWGPGPFWGPAGYPYWGPDPFWGGWAIPPSISQQSILLTNAELISTKTSQVLWSGAFSTDLGEQSQEATYQSYADLIVQSLRSNGFTLSSGALLPAMPAPVVAPK